MQEHAAIGYRILCDSPSPLLQMAAVIAYSHHEKFDGTGYPQGLAGHVIPLVGRIVAVADVLDALTSRRPYKKAWSFEDAKAFLLEQSGRHFDPTCVQALMDGWAEAEQISVKFRDEPMPRFESREVSASCAP